MRQLRDGADKRLPYTVFQASDFEATLLRELDPHLSTSVELQQGLPDWPQKSFLPNLEQVQMPKTPALSAAQLCYWREWCWFILKARWKGYGS